MNTVIAHEH